MSRYILPATEKDKLFSCRYEDATCLVTMGTGKYYSVGVDMEWGATLSDDEAHQFMHELFCRILVFPLVTVAALNGKIIPTLI